MVNTMFSYQIAASQKITNHAEDQPGLILHDFFFTNHNLIILLFMKTPKDRIKKKRQ